MTWDRLLLGVGYVLLAVGCIGWWAVAPEVDRSTLLTASLAILLAAGVLVLTTRWRAHSSTITPLPSAVGLAVATPLAMVPLVETGAIGPVASAIGLASATSTTAPPDVGAWSGIAVGFALVAAAAAVAPMGWELTKRVPSGPGQQSTRLTLGACLAIAPVLAFMASHDTEARQAEFVGPMVLWWVLITIAVLTVSLTATLATRRDGITSRRFAGTDGSGNLGIGVAVSASAFALAVSWWPILVVPVLTVAGTMIFLGRLVIRPLEAEADSARTERDLVVAALEAERNRVSSTIHDGPLGDLALLVQRLDTAGDEDSAELARADSADLRTLGNELRVPILEDLGAGPAIEWLADRVSERTQTSIHTMLRGSEGRPPAPVELAAFRIAQEAILNAAKHGRGPVSVRYEADCDTASLTVTDAGPGITSVAREQAAQDGHLGLGLMAQRAQAIGAHLEISSPQSGGTQVDLVWAAT